ncbi:MAG TPA: hypothetical protein VJ790_16505 [Dongiaceae bacterium]|nr:hypothetical protein [Dongiaceae bacterium]
MSLDLARAAAAAGYRVGLADSTPAYAARIARIGPVLRLPPPRFAFSAFAERLAEHCARDPDCLIIPTCEEVFFVRAAAERHGFTDHVLASDMGILRQLHSKIEFAALLGTLGLPAPRTEALDGRAAVGDGAGAVFKPEFSRFGSATLIRPDARRRRSIAPTPSNRWARQEFVEGEEFCLWSAARSGTLCASVVYRPKWRKGRSAAYAFEAVDAPGVVEIARHLARALDYTGQIGLDMIRNAKGEFIPVECNPRSVSGLHLFDGDPALAKALTGDGPAVHVTRGLRYIAPAMWIMGWPESVRRGRRQEWRADMRAGQDVLGRDGIAPVAGALLDAAIFAATGLTRLRSPAGQTTDDIEWNGEPIA